MTAETALTLPIATPPRRSGNGSAMDVNATVPKALGLIQVKEQAGSLSLQDQKVINVLLYYSHDTIVNPHAVHETTLQSLREYLGEHESNDQVRESLANISRVHLEFDYTDADGDRRWGSGSLLVVSGHEQGSDGVVKYTWPHWLRPLLAEPAKWARLSMPVVRAFKSKYGVRLYENLEMVANRHVKEWIVEVDDLRALLGVGDRLRDWRDFCRRAVEPAVEEVDRFADFTVDWEVHATRGRKVASLRFVVVKKDVRDTREFNGRAAKYRRAGTIALKAETFERARQIARGYDVYAIEAQWKAFSAGKPRPRNPDGAFIRFAEKWVARRQQGNLLI